MTWGRALLIALIWIGGTIILYIVLHLLDKVFKFQNHKGWSDLGRAISYLVCTFLPPAFFLLVVLFMKIEGYSRIIFLIIAALVILGLPAFVIITKALNPPDKLADYCMKSAGDYDKFHSYYEEAYGTKLKRDVSEHEVIANYIENQLNFVYKRLKIAFKYTKIENRSIYIEAVMKKNQKLFPDISHWEILDNVHPGLWYQKHLFIYYKDGDRSILWLAYKLNHDDKLAGYIRKYGSRQINEILLWKDFKDITMTGRLCYDFICIEQYMLTLYPEADWSRVKYMWRITKHNGFGWGGWVDVVKKAAVNALIDYEDKMSGKIDMSPKARKKRLNEITDLISTVEQAAENVIHNEKYRTGFNLCEQESIETIYFVQSFLTRNDIPLPEVSVVDGFRFDRSTVRQDGENKEAWGYDVETEGLSRIEEA